ncbi:MAG: 3-oxoacyl-[acyl-carrier protein] reductase [Actinomycetota bacterium]|jgi:NAD(P)-dependent dehydrogenase (short-subunit alcohol dehydrogenase family)|nr:3-oxoacyl-[acyl-carrier protein] reductase [Actinomycetota bacterium]
MKTCLVTGAGRGIGRAVAERLSADGHRVGLVARSKDELDEVAASLPGESLVVAADLTVPGEVDRVFGEVARAWGDVEVLVANAGAGHAALVTDTTDEDWARVLELNLTVPFRCIRRALPSMVDAGWGRVVVIASVVAKRGEAQVSAYAASKHGVLGLVRSAAAEVARTGVTVNAVCPGYVDTPMTDATVAAISARSARSEDESRAALAKRQPIGRLVTPAEVADVVALCVGNGAINGQGINVDGGAVQS